MPDLKHTSSIVLANALKDWGARRWKSNGQTGIKFPPLPELRARFDSKHGPQEWDDTKAWSHLGSSL